MRDAKENQEKKMAARNPGNKKRAKGLSAGIFPRSLFTVTLDGLSDRGTTCSLAVTRILCYIQEVRNNINNEKNTRRFCLRAWPLIYLSFTLNFLIQEIKV